MAAKRKYGIITGSMVALLTTLASAAIMARMISVGVLEETCIDYWVISTLLVSTWIGTKAGLMQNTENRMRSCLLTGGIYFCILLLFNAVCFEGQYQNVIMTALTVLISCILSIITGINKRNRGKKRRRKI